MLAIDPLFSRETLNVYVEKEERSHLKKKMKSYGSNTTGKVQEEKDEIKEMKCPVCEENHDLDNCKNFSNMSVDERSKMPRRKRLCYGCYLPVSAEHTAKTCKKRRLCKICAMKHATGLHGYEPRWKQKQVRERLGASGKSEIIIKTLNGDQEVASTVISRLKVPSDTKGVRQHWLNLPAT